MTDDERRALNAALAERLFGYQWYHIHGQPDWRYLVPSESMRPHADRRYPCEPPAELNRDNCSLVPDFCGADWPEVARAMRANGWMVKTLQRPTGGLPEYIPIKSKFLPLAEVELVHIPTTNTVWAGGDVLEETGCKAAYRALTGQPWVWPQEVRV